MNLSDRIEIDYPWKIVAYQNVLTDEKLAEYTKQFDEINWKDLWDSESCWWRVEDHDIVKDVTQLFGSPPDEVLLKLDLPENTLQVPHCDDNDRQSLQLFLQVEDQPFGGTIVMDKPCKTGFEFPLLSNSMLYMDNGPNSWHYVRQRGYLRKSILMRWRMKRLER